MERWDLYDENRRPTGEIMLRGQAVPEGWYHLTVDLLFLNSRGETLLQRRAKEKEICPDVWSFAGGAVTAGETMAQGCVREGAEELGFTPDISRGRVLYTETGKTYIRDVYLFRQDVPRAAMRLQPEEVQDAMWILPEKIRQDAALWQEMQHVSYMERVYPYLCLESMRIRIPKGEYRHYKGGRYRALGLALHSETLEPMVIYQALYGAGEIWVRPAAMWLETVETQNGLAPRFALEKEE